MEHTSEDCQCEGKKCPRCEIKCHGSFWKSKTKGTLYPYCKECAKTYDKEHPRPNGKESKRKSQEKWKQKNTVKIKAYASQWGKKNRKRSMEKQREWERNNREKYLAIASAGDAKRRARKTLAGGSYTAQEWQDLKAKYDYTCLRCGRKEPDIKLTADHVVPIAKHGTSFINNIQPLCMACNIWKRDRFIDFRPKSP